LKETEHLFLQYEEVTEQPEVEFKRLFAYLGLTYAPEYAASVAGTSSFDESRQAEGIYKSSHFAEYFTEDEQQEVEYMLRSYLLRYGYELAFENYSVSRRRRVAYRYHYIKHALYFALCRWGLRRIFVWLSRGKYRIENVS
jgi:hypothetical protein